jgi:hypothetical protein
LEPREIGVEFNLELPVGRAEILQLTAASMRTAGEHPE